MDAQKFCLVFASFDDGFALARIGPVGQIASDAFVQHFRGLSNGRGQFLGLFETFVLALVDDVGLAAIQAAVDEFAARFQNVLGGGHAFGGIGFALRNEIGQFGGQGQALGLASFRRHLVHVDQAVDARFEVSIATQFEQSEEFLDTFAFGRFGASVYARFGLGGDRAEFRPGFRIANSGRNGGGSVDVGFDESAHLGATFGRAHVFGRQVAEGGIGTHFGLDRFPALVQARVVSLVVFGEGATKNGQQEDNDFHF